MKRTLIAISVVALLGAAPVAAQVDLSRYVSLGDSTTAGFTHGGLVDCYQNLSWPALLARQGHASTFEMPLVSSPGLPPLLQLFGFDFSTGQAVPIIAPIPGDPGFPYNAEYPLPYNNLAVTGSNLFNLLFTTGDIGNLLVGDFSNVMHDITLRFPVFPGTEIPAPAIAQAIALQPTFVTLWIGNNDVLGAVLNGSALDGITMTPVEVFGLLYPQAVGALVSQTAADIVLMTVIDVTEIPIITTVPPFIQIPGVGVFPIQGSNGPLPADARVLSTAAELLGLGYGLPLPGSPPLPEDLDLATGEPGYVLRAEEITAIKNRVAAYNQIIRDTEAAFGLEVFDAGGWVDDATEGDGYTYGGVTFSAEFLTGGLVGFDGIHKQQNGHAFFTVELIDFLNERFGANIDQLNLAEVVFSNPCAIPVPVAAKADDVVFSKRAHRQLLDVIVPDIPAQMEQLAADEPAVRSRARGRRLAP
jgi:hypothetical protein